MPDNDLQESHLPGSTLLSSYEALLPICRLHITDPVRPLPGRGGGHCWSVIYRGRFAARYAHFQEVRIDLTVVLSQSARKES